MVRWQYGRILLSMGFVYNFYVFLWSQRLDNSTKVIILSVNGLLCFEKYINCTPRRFDRNNIIVRPGLLEFMRILLRSFKVGIWSCMFSTRLKKVLEVLFPEDIRSRLLFVYGRNQCSRPQQYPLCDKLLWRLSSDLKTKEFCLPGKMLMVDDQPMRNVFNGDFACYFPNSWHGEMTLPNASNVIPNIGTALLPYILPLRLYASVYEYLRGHPMDGRFKRRLIESWQIELALRSH